MSTSGQDRLVYGMLSLASKLRSQFNGTCATCLDEHCVLRDGDKVIAYTHPIAWLRDMGISPFLGSDPERCPACIEQEKIEELVSTMKGSETKT